jgi:hypothetical protein
MDEGDSEGVKVHLRWEALFVLVVLSQEYLHAADRFQCWSTDRNEVLEKTDRTDTSIDESTSIAVQSRCHLSAEHRS